VIDPNGVELGVSDSRSDTRNLGVLARFNLAAWAIGCAWAFCGVIRVDALKQTRLLRPVIETDLVLLSELALLGHFANVPEVLFYPRNKWGDESNRGKRWRRFWDSVAPEYKGRRVWFPYFGWGREELLAVRHSRLDPGRKTLLMLSVFPAYFSRYRIYLPQKSRQAVRSLLRQLLGF